MIGISFGDQNVLIVFTKELLRCNVSALSTPGVYLAGAGPSEEEVLGLVYPPTPPHRPIWPSTSLHQFYVHIAMGP